MDGRKADKLAVECRDCKYLSLNHQATLEPHTTLFLRSFKVVRVKNLGRVAETEVVQELEERRGIIWFEH